MVRIIDGIVFENNNSNTQNDPFTEAIIQQQEEQRLIRKIVEQVKRELTIDKMMKKKIEKSLRMVVDEAAKTVEKEFQKNGGTVSR